MTPITTVVRVIDEQASLEHVERYRSRRSGLHFEHYDYGRFDGTSRRLQAYGFVIAALIMAATMVVSAVIQ